MESVFVWHQDFLVVGQGREAERSTSRAARAAGARARASRARPATRARRRPRRPRPRAAPRPRRPRRSRRGDEREPGSLCRAAASRRRAGRSRSMPRACCLLGCVLLLAGHLARARAADRPAATRCRGRGSRRPRGARAGRAALRRSGPRARASPRERRKRARSNVARARGGGARAARVLCVLRLSPGSRSGGYRPSEVGPDGAAAAPV